MTEPLRLGLVGADASGRGWGPVAHMPALAGLDEIELAAVCTSRLESADAASEAFGIPAFHDVRELAAQPDIDIVSVVVRVPRHRDVVVPALEAGKHVFSEWPLGANLAEAEEMAALARSKGVVTAVGLQGRNDPTLAYVKELHDEGWLGELLTVNVTMFGGGALGHNSSEAWMGDNANGANTMTIVAGHTLDQIAHCFGAFTAVSGKIAVQVPQWKLADAGETIDVDAPDNIAVNATLATGALVSYQAATVPNHATGWRLEAFGTEGTLKATTAALPQITPIVLKGARGDDPLVEMDVPDRLNVVPDGFPFGPARNVGGTYRRMAEAIRGRGSYLPDFDHAVKVHRLLDAIERSSAEGRTIQVGS
ncbi:MAG: Gfo/Idh/MocA family oxidoreductase [Acidimicrobiia bacterium]|nr:Gfo/Idh/MocA family oxidoreductase [Acidimicrobiia bacterium]